MGEQRIETSTAAVPLLVPEQQATFNASTRLQWQTFAAHRGEVERLIVRARPPAPLSYPATRPRLCVLGAGNCNDLDLPHLATLFGEVHLVDLDPAALAEATGRQKVAAHPAIRTHAPIDLTGVADEIGRWSARPPSEADVAACITRAARPPLSRADDASALGSFDVVLSPCVLSQLFTPARDTIGESHPRFDALLAAIRLGHLRTLAALLAPGGSAVLVTDVASSARVPDLPRVPREQLAGLLGKVIAARKTLRGLDPDSILAATRSDPATAPLADSVEQSAPWLWHLCWGKTYLVYALIFRSERLRFVGSASADGLFSQVPKVRPLKRTLPDCANHTKL